MEMIWNMAAVAALSVLAPAPAAALTVDGFREVCKRVTEGCESHPMLQAYVGGSLDMIATLDERTTFLGEVYCRSPKELFDVGAIIRYVEQAPDADGDANAMTLVLRYLVEEGGC